MSGARLLEAGDTAEGLRVSRDAIEKASPAVAVGCADEITSVLEMQNHAVEAEALRSEFRQKLKKGDAETRREQ